MPEPVTDAITEFDREQDVTLSDYLRPQPDEAAYYAIGATASGAYGLADEPTAVLLSAPAGAVGGYVYAKLRKHRQGRRAARNSWENVRDSLSGEGDTA